jgi:hypothetical protein
VRRPLVLVVVLVVCVFAAAAASWPTSASNVTSSPPIGLSAYGKTLWQLDALLNDTYGSKTTNGWQLCFKFSVGDVAAKFTRRCESFAETSFWNPVFADARHSAFRLFRLRRAPILGNVVDVTVRGYYVSCGSFSKHSWLVIRHGSTLLPFVCVR